MNILIADDDRIVVHLLSTRLRALRWNVTVAHDAMQALMFAVRSNPNAIVLDVNMPGGTGVDTLRKLKASVKTALIPVVVVSGTTDPDMPARVQELGAEAFLAKPVDPESLIALLSKLTGA